MLRLIRLLRSNVILRDFHLLLYRRGSLRSQDFTEIKVRVELRWHSLRHLILLNLVIEIEFIDSLIFIQEEAMQLNRGLK